MQLEAYGVFRFERMRKNDINSTSLVGVGRKQQVLYTANQRTIFKLYEYAIEYKYANRQVQTAAIVQINISTIRALNK